MVDRLAPNKIIDKDKRIGCGVLDVDVANNLYVNRPIIALCDYITHFTN
jgi:hypothetical protein